MKQLPIGIQTFEKLRKNNFLYVDKTSRFLDLIQSGTWYFLSRPRRFGKSLTLSTLEAMFKGKTELFQGLAAQDWVQEQSKNPAPVLRFDMSSIGIYETAEELNERIIGGLKNFTFVNLNFSFLLLIMFT